MSQNELPRPQIPRNPYEVVTLRTIDALDAAQAEDFAAWNEVHTAGERAVLGDLASPWTIDELIQRYRSDTLRRTAVGAFDGGSLVGAVEVALPMRDNLDMANFWLSVHPDHWRRGIGSLLVARAEELASAAGRHIMVGESQWAAGRRDSAEEFAARHGYAVAQTVLRSELALPMDENRLAALAEGRSGDFAVETYWDGIPDELLDDRALLARRMSTDAPLGDLALEEEEWDAQRVREDYAEWLGSGRRIVESVARHLPSRRLVGFTRLMVSAGSPELAYQGDTLVIREHRGNGLGLRLKASNALALMDALPEVRSVRTWNADDNEHMLAVNRSLGFEVNGGLREWQRRVV